VALSSFDTTEVSNVYYFNQVCKSVSVTCKWEKEEKEEHKRRRRTFIHLRFTFVVWFFCWGMIFCYFSIWYRKDGLCGHFESVFLLNEWWMSGLDGFSWIVCWNELVILFKYLKVTTFIVGKGVTVHGRQCNEHMKTFDLVAKTSNMVSPD